MAAVRGLGMMRLRKRMVVAAGVVVLLVADGVAWWVAQRALDDGLDRWRAEMAASGIEVSAGEASRGGWPFAATRSLTAVTLRGGGASTTVARATLALSPFVPDSLLELPGEVTVAVAGMAPVRVAARDWAVRLPRDPAAPVTMDAVDVRAGIDDGGEPARWLGASAVHVAARPEAGGDVSVTASAQSVTLPVPPGVTLPLGGRLASVSTEFVWHGALPPPVLTAPSVAAWRDAGGAVLVRRFALGYGPLGLSGQGRFQLDGALQPVGRATLHIVGFAETLDALAAGRVITSFVATAAGAELGLLATTPPGGGAPRVDTELTVADGVASVARFPLLALPRLAWPPAP